MEEALSKIRPHTTSSLAHQKAPATLLRALEATLAEQGAERTPTAYFAALLTTLEGTLKGNAAGSGAPALGEGDLLPAELYLLALVAPYVPGPVLRAQLNTLLSLTAPLFPLLATHAPPLRSQLAIYAALLPVLDKTQLDAPGVRQCFSSILALALDPRPKVRRKAAEVIRDVLADPPAPMARHPYAERVAEWAANSLRDAAASPIGKHKGKKAADGDATDAAIHLLAFLRMVVPSLPPSIWPTLTTHLLTLPRLGNPYLSQASYSLLSSLLSAPTSPNPLDLETLDLTPQLPAILKSVLSSPPSKTDNTLAPSWLLLLGHTLLVLSASDVNTCSTELPKAWKAAWAFLDNGDGTIRSASAQSLDLLCQAFVAPFIAAGVADAPVLASGGGGEPRTALGRIVVQTIKAFDTLSFAPAIPDLLAVVSSLLSGLRTRPSGPSGPTAAESLLLPLVVKIATLRTTKSFEHKEAADAVLGRAMSVLGPHILLTHLPLNLEPADRAAGREPRAFLLPLLPAPHPSPLGHFVGYFVPLSERMFELQSEAEEKGREAEAKVWSVLIGQVWAGLVGYCHVTPDLPQALTPEFAQLLSQLLYTQPDLRPAVLRALKAMVDSNAAAAKEDNVPDPGDMEGVEKRKTAEKNVKFLESQAASWLAVLFNVFGSVDRDARAGVGDVVASWVGVASEADIASAYRNVLGLFRTNVNKADPSVAGATLDLLLLLLPSLGEKEAREMMEFILSGGALMHADNGVQKRAYKLLARVIETDKVAVDAKTVLEKMEEASEGLVGAAKRERMRVLAVVVGKLGDEGLWMIPGLIPEAVLGTKEPSEKARAEAFELVVEMARRMQKGGVVRRAKIGDREGMEEEGMEGEEEEVKASLEEFVTMLAGGLAGATPHMISATVTALSRIVFEFKDEISTDMHLELFTTLLVFLQSANREIVKATLGYVKLVVHSLPAELLRPQLGALVPALLRWSHPGKNAFKLKVRHVFERMIRRFGWEEVYAAAQEEEGRKVLVNIRKRKERAKKKRAAAATAQDEDEDDVAPRGKNVAGDAFEDVLYGSESELDSDEEDEADARAPAQRGQNAKERHGARLRVDDDEPMDLLHGAAGAVTINHNERRRRPGQDAKRFRTDEDTGKMVIDEDSEEEDEVEIGASGAGGDAVAGGAYQEALTSADGFTRAPNGRVKFNKDTKKRRRDNAEMEVDDIEMGGAAVLSSGPSPGKKAKKKQEPRLGSEFKAKKAGGDVKKGNVDPYAYLSLSQAAKKMGGKSGRIGIASKR